MVMDYTQVLIRPLITEKATYAKEAANQVVFLVHDRANKIDVKRAVEEAFKVKVDAVNIVRRQPRVIRRRGRPTGKAAGHKKAYVSLAEGEKIEIFEGV